TVGPQIEFVAYPSSPAVMKTRKFSQFNFENALPAIVIKRRDDRLSGLLKRLWGRLCQLTPIAE
ncbi:MAG: hypothetical protein ABJZ55_10240, partial [Fuerstiella sp.]